MRAAHMLPMQGLPLASPADAQAMNVALSNSSCVLWHEDKQDDLFLRLDLSGVDHVLERVHGRYRVQVFCGDETIAEGHVAVEPHHLTWLQEEVLVIPCELRQMANAADLGQGIRVRLTPGEDTFGMSAKALQGLAQRTWPVRLEMAPEAHDVPVVGLVIKGLPVEAYAEATPPHSAEAKTTPPK
jgi:hypothetical protein